MKTRFEASCEYLDDMKAICVGGYSGRIYVLRASSGDLIHSAKCATDFITPFVAANSFEVLFRLSPDPMKSACVYDSSSRRTWLSCSNGTLFSLCISTNGIEQEASIGLDGPTFGAPLCLSSESFVTTISHT
jgi:outer membrane protein assembly factor BamB